MQLTDNKYVKRKNYKNLYLKLNIKIKTMNIEQLESLLRQSFYLLDRSFIVAYINNELIIVNESASDTYIKISEDGSTWELYHEGEKIKEYEELKPAVKKIYKYAI